jgi:hypothetical protein
MLLRPKQIFRLVLPILLLVGLALPISTIMPSAKAAVTVIKVNFQNETGPVPSGYLRDFGEAFGLRVGASQGGGQFSYGWIDPLSGLPLSLVGNGRQRSRSDDQRLDTLVHMQGDDIPGFSGVPLEGAWEIALPNGNYYVLASVGDAASSTNPESHSLRVEGMPLVSPNFVSGGADGTLSRHRLSATTVTVADGKLTVDAASGYNTKINYLEIEPVDAGALTHPYVTGVTPAPGATDVRRDAGVSATVFVPNGGIDDETVNAATVRLMNQRTGELIPVTFNSSGGGDIIVLKPLGFLDANTTYRFDVSPGVLDGSQIAFQPFTSQFTTGTSGGPVEGNSPIAFKQTKRVATGEPFSSLVWGPDGKLYAATLQGDILRYDVNGANGTLGNRQRIGMIRSAEGLRAIIGLAWDPAASANNLILWVSHNGPYVPQDAADWTGKIARMTDKNKDGLLDSYVNVVENLPHSYKDHMNNGLAFGPDGKLYLSNGSNTAMGAADPAWGNRPERLLSAAILQLDAQALAGRSSPLNVKTEDGGSYNPSAPGAPVKLYATGVRNAYDLIWHSNGQLYAPTNGSAAGGNVPAIPSRLPSACDTRIDGKAYTGPKGKPGINGVAQVQKDWLFRIEAGGYYGHPNPLRCEWILNGGNPKSGSGNDGPTEVYVYPGGTQPDPNFRGADYDFGLNSSPNGSTEYRSNTFGGALKGRLLVTRYSLPDDIIVLTPGSVANPGSTNHNIVKAEAGLPGLTGFYNPIDVVENPQTGALYVAELGLNALTLLEPVASGTPDIDVEPERVILNEPVSGSSASMQVIIRNVGTGPLKVSGLSLLGPDAAQFQVSNFSLPKTIPASSAVAATVQFDPTSIGVKNARLRITSNAANNPSVEVELRGLGTLGSGGTQEPSLQWILDTYGYDVQVGDPNPADNLMPTSWPLGQEVKAQRFERADNANPVLIEPLAVFGPSSTAGQVLRFGWYKSGSASQRTELFNVPNSAAQTLNVTVGSGAQLSFDPGTERFGFYSVWPFFGNRSVYSEDALNTFDAETPHHVRVYPLRENGALAQDTYVVAFEEHTSEHDYNDVVVIVRNVRPAAPTITAGPDKSGQIGGLIVLSGSAEDPDGDTLTLSWTQTAGPPVQLSGANSPTASFVPTSAGEYTFLLTASDGATHASDSVVVTVSAGSGGAPTADAGPDKSALIGETVTLNGGGSDPNGDPLSYSWVQLDGPRAQLSGASSATASFVPSKAGLYTFVLTVSDGALTGVDSVVVTVASRALVADAGVHQAVRLGERVRLSGSGSDPDGAPARFSWAQVAGPEVTLAGAESVVAEFTPTRAGSYVFVLTVDDGVSSSSDTVVVLVVADEPLVNAGVDMVIGPGKPASLSAVGGSADGSALSYSWVQVSGPPVTLSGADTPTPSFKAPPAQGALVFRVMVTDGVGRTASDEIVVLVQSSGPELSVRHFPLVIVGMEGR